MQMPAAFPCRNAQVGCLPGTNAQDQSPVRNFSVETPDLPIYIGTFIDNGTGDGGGTPPRLGGFRSPGCVGICTSTVSQEEADQCARDQAMLCSTPPGELVWPNSQQTCIVECPDGEPFSWTVAPGGTDGSHGFVPIPAPNPGGGSGPIVVPQLPPLTITTNANLEGIAGVVNDTAWLPAFDYPLQAAGGAGSYHWELVDPIQSPLPPGLTVQDTINDYGEISGTPTQSGTYLTRIKVTDALGNTVAKEFRFRIPQIVPWTVLGPNHYALPDGLIGQDYNAGIEPMTGLPIPIELKGTSTHGELVWSLKEGTLPPGLKLDAKTGIISGVPSSLFGAVIKAYDFVVQLLDNGGVRNYSAVYSIFRITTHL